MKLEILNSSVYLIEQELDGVTVRGAIVLGTKSALVWDTLIFPSDMRELTSLFADRECIVVYSHADWDHIWGTCGLNAAQVIAHSKCAERFLDKNDVAATLDEYRAKFPTELAEVTLVPPTSNFDSNFKIDLGGITVELSHCPGHTADSIIARIPECSLLLGADSVERPLPILNQDAQHLDNWIKQLESIRNDIKITKVVPSHGAIGGRELVLENIEYLQALRKGDNHPVPEKLDSFYLSAHTENQRLVAEFKRSKNS